MKAFPHFPVKRVLLAGILLILASTLWVHGQGTTYSYFYRVYLKDKGGNIPGNFTLSALLSSRSIERRQKTGISLPDITDLPVWTDYLDQITSKGFTLHCTSKWLNTALFKTQTRADINILLSLPFVSDVKIVKIPGTKGNFNDKLDFTIEQSVIPFDRPITMVNGGTLHNQGFDGTNVLIAILDGGFTNADKISSLSDLRNRGGIKSTYDFINKNNSVFNANIHGCAVLSILAGNIPDQIAGSAPGADYLLLKTEDVFSEFPCEEDFWAAGAEFADSAGADVISSSLGYFNFDDPTLNYKYSDLDGKTAFVTRAADMAVSKGIVVVNSAGNERDGVWKRIIFPADGINVEAAGAVDGNNNISTFSSAGPSADGRVKPDNAAMGVAVPIQVDTGPVVLGSGTSFSCPVLSGMAACLLQALPAAVNTDIVQVFHSSADRYAHPDSLYGYGIPDMGKALALLQDKYLKIPDEDVSVYPNPTTGNIEVIFRQAPGTLTIEIVTLTGKLIFKQIFPEFAGRILKINELQTREQGMYFVRLTTEKGKTVHKIIKIRK
jgi:serine protease AprX